MMNAVRTFIPHVVMLSQPFLEALPELARLARQRHFALLMLAEKDDDAAEYVDLGFQGVIYRSADPTTAVKAVRRLALGESFVQPSYPVRSGAAADFVSAPPKTRLTPTEIHIIRFVSLGYKNRDIAIQLNLTEQAIKNALRVLFDKLGMSDRLGLALYALSDPHLHKAISRRSTTAPWVKASKATTRIAPGLPN